MVAGGGGIELGRKQLVEVGLLGRGHVESQREGVELEVCGGGAEIGCVLHVTADVTGHCDAAVPFDGAGDAVLGSEGRPERLG